MEKQAIEIQNDCEPNKHKQRLKLLVLLCFAIPVFTFVVVLSVFSNRCSCGVASNEATAIASLKVIAIAQSIFIKTDYYEGGELVYANPKDGRGIADLYEVGYDGSNATSGAHKTLERTVANADDSNKNPIRKGGYLVRDLKCDDYTKQFAAVAYPEFYGGNGLYILGVKVERGLCGRNIFVMNESGAVYKIDAKILYPDIRIGDAIPMAITEYPKDLSKWIEAGR